MITKKLPRKGIKLSGCNLVGQYEWESKKFLYIHNPDNDTYLRIKKFSPAYAGKQIIFNNKNL